MYARQKIVVFNNKYRADFAAGPFKSDCAAAISKQSASLFKREFFLSVHTGVSWEVSRGRDGTATYPAYTLDPIPGVKDRSTQRNVE
jgi:hypothetical protein